MSRLYADVVGGAVDVIDTLLCLTQSYCASGLYGVPLLPLREGGTMRARGRRVRCLVLHIRIYEVNERYFCFVSLVSCPVAARRKLPLISHDESLCVQVVAVSARINILPV